LYALRNLAFTLGSITTVFIIFAISSIVLADAVDPGDGPQEFQLEQSLPFPAKPMYPRLDSQLNAIIEGIGQMTPQVIADEAHFHQDPSVAVTIRLSGNIPEAVVFLKVGGATVANIGTDFIEAHVPVTLLANLEQQIGVLSVRTIIAPYPQVTSQGTLVHGSPNWNTAGFTGAGVKVGIIDSGFEGFGDLMGTELPSTVVARCYILIGIFTSSLADCYWDGVHGTAVAEAVVDIAPDVTLYIANPQSNGDLQSSVSWMVSQGVTVINMSMGMRWDGPGNGTSSHSESPINTVDSAVAGGAIWVNAAGNYALSNWFGSYSDLNDNGWIEFDAGVEVNAVELVEGETLHVEVRWDDNWGIASRDFDLHLYDSSMTTRLTKQGDQQSGIAGQDPSEKFMYTATATGTYYLAIQHLSGGMPSWLQLRAGTGQHIDIATAETSVANPASSANPGMLAVGATNWATPDIIEDFSSQGPTTDGRTKPDIVGVDRGDSASMGAFPGTSQASPHVAGLAALVLQRFPMLTPAEVASYLKDNAFPRSNVPNNIWGSGLAHLPSVPTTLAFSTQPSGAVAWSAFTTQPVVVITDSEGNTVTSATDSVSVRITSGTGAAGSSLFGTVTVPAVNGVAAFTDLSIKLGGTGYTLTASSGSLTSAVSSSFDVADIPTLTSVSIDSNSVTSSGTNEIGKVGDVVTLSFSVDAAIQTPTVAVTVGDASPSGSVTVTNTNGNEWTAVFTLESGDTDGTVAFTIDFVDSAGNAGTQVASTTDSSSVTFDTTAPTLTNVSIDSDNATNIGTDEIATHMDTVTLSFTTDEVIQTPTVAFTVAGAPGSRSAKVTNAVGNNWTATFLLDFLDDDGPIAFTIDFNDMAGFAGTQVSSTTDSTSVALFKVGVIPVPGTSFWGLAATAVALLVLMTVALRRSSGRKQGARL
jgi:subtilisin family serine protease